MVGLWPLSLALGFCMAYGAQYQGDLSVEVLAMGGSSRDEVLYVAADDDFEYIVSRLNTQSGDPDHRGLQETISVAKVDTNLANWTNLHGWFDCDHQEGTRELNCTQEIHPKDAVVSPITGMVAFNGDAILAGCFRQLDEDTEKPCASIIRPGKWIVEAVSNDCVNMQGGIAIVHGEIVVSGLYMGKLEFNETEIVGDKYVTEKSRIVILQSSGISSFSISVNPKTGKIVKYNSRPGIEVLFMAALHNLNKTPQDVEDSDLEDADEATNQSESIPPMYTLARNLGPASEEQCTSQKLDSVPPANGAFITDNYFSGEGIFFSSEDNGFFVPTGMVADAADSGILYISGSFKGIFTLPGEYQLESELIPGTSEHSEDGFLIKVNYENKTFAQVEWVLRIGGGGKNQATGVDANDGEVYLVGNFESELRVDGWEPVHDGGEIPRLVKREYRNTVNKPLAKSRGAQDVFVLKLQDGDVGKLQWVFTAGGGENVTSVSSVTSVAIGQKRTVHMAGMFSEDIQFPGGKSLTSRGDYDGFVASITEAPDKSRGKQTLVGDVWGRSSLAILVTIAVMSISCILMIWRSMAKGKKNAACLERSMDMSTDQLGKRVLRVVGNLDHSDVALLPNTKD